MKTSVFGWTPLQVVAGFVFIAAGPLANVWAQSPPGPLPQTASQDGSAPAAQTTAPRPDVPRTKILAGTWRLNLDESDDPEAHEPATEARSALATGRVSFVVHRCAGHAR